MAQHTGTVRVRPAETERRTWFPLASAAPDSLPSSSRHEIWGINLSRRRKKRHTFSAMRR
jgi:hypothetical protein